MTQISTKLNWRDDELFAGDIYIGSVWCPVWCPAWTARIATGYSASSLGEFGYRENARSALEQAARTALEEKS